MDISKQDILETAEYFYHVFGRLDRKPETTEEITYDMHYRIVSSLLTIAYYVAKGVRHEQK